MNCGWVKITLKPDQSLTWIAGEMTEEGPSWQMERFEHVGTSIVNTSATWGSDCDGRHESHCSNEAAYHELSARLFSSYPDGEYYAVPIWHKLESGQRDHTAEAAGY